MSGGACHVFRLPCAGPLFHKATASAQCKLLEQGLPNPRLPRVQNPVHRPPHKRMLTRFFSLVQAGELERNPRGQQTRRGNPGSQGPVPAERVLHAGGGPQLLLGV